MNDNVFDKMIGYKEVKQELLLILDRLQNPQKYQQLGVTPPHNLLLYGAPGVGKTMFTQCFMDALGWKQFVCRKVKPNGDFVHEIAEIFAKAEAQAPAVILLDDMDKFANEDEGHRDAEEFVAIQSCIDGIKGKQVFVVATANNRHKLPESLVRAGRFDHRLHLERPSGTDAEQIVAHYLRQRKNVAQVDAKRIARLTAGNSCAELETIINLAGTYAGYEGSDRIEMPHILKAILRIVFSAPEVAEDDGMDIALVACHEAGHAVISQLLEPGSVDLVSVCRHKGEVGGITSQYQARDYFQSKKRMENRVLCLLAGKAATELCYGVTDTGTTEDMRRAFDIVLRFVDDYCSYGFDKFVFRERSSNDLLSRREQQVASELDRYYTQVKQMLAENRRFLDALTARLIAEKTLLAEQIAEVQQTA